MLQYNGINTRALPKHTMTVRHILDRFGSTSSLVCALHCALLPIVISVLPALGLGFMAWSGFEWAFVIFASLLGLFSLWIGYQRHRVVRALLFLLPGLALVWAGILVPSIHHSVFWHAVAMSAGGTLIAVAHLINLRLNHSHVHDASCHHAH
jgi:MerC mercury resistance protein